MTHFMHTLGDFCGVTYCLIVLGAACLLVYWLIRDLVRDLVRVFFEPAKPPCQSCGSFIFCAISDVKKCPKIKPWYRRLWRKS